MNVWEAEIFKLKEQNDKNAKYIRKKKQEFKHKMELLEYQNKLLQDEIQALKKLKADTDALDKKLFESIQKSNEVWDKATKSILKKAKK